MVDDVIRFDRGNRPEQTTKQSQTFIGKRPAPETIDLTETPD